MSEYQAITRIRLTQEASDLLAETGRKFGYANHSETVMAALESLNAVSPEGLHKMQQDTGICLMRLENSLRLLSLMVKELAESMYEKTHVSPDWLQAQVASILVNLSRLDTKKGT